MHRTFFGLFIMLSVNLQAQPLAKGDIVPDFAIKKILNSNTQAASLKDIKGNITIIDFFGTWCIPCIRALPVLENFKKENPQAAVILISEEKEEKLKNFIAKRNGFTFPVICDEEKNITGRFQPPSYPYTVIINAENNIIEIFSGKELDKEMLAALLVKTQPEAIAETNPFPVTETKKNTVMQSNSNAGNPLLKLSQDFVYAAKTNEDAAGYMQQLSKRNYDSLLTGLQTDDDKKAFWINLYNAYTNVSLHKNPEQYKNRNKFFKTKNINIAGKKFSLDDIEHGILRRSKIKWGLGYLNKWFPGKTEKELRVNTVDYRIHFALNCGAKSCPPIAFYKSESINQQLELATAAYLTGEASYDEAKNRVTLPKLMSWFRRDFGGRKKIISLLQDKKIIPAGVSPKLKYKKYDWTLYLDNFKN